LTNDYLMNAAKERRDIIKCKYKYEAGFFRQQ